ncbi:type II toxin-antitoxin system ParD family antitoxin [Nostoc spongiaeforme FACHB-130]|uniref:Type II toxin-antitoxin system ParD family antitoxin n=1 Tax=Nostoc spongiaeforme FACHB-130 TaxID=1357510 RepID=A0ABR8G2E6_9NOSO|nr:type II toxin-antitoxin system ParD family antitoxin [Nostoc spongiaeforme]MBD2597357.1 type II toxin-antitoxin system ParD family antitoxin [Nostoc spongiaeforme FACHB-130]
MSNVEKISVALTPEMVAFVRNAVESGEYASSSEVIREALRDWKQKRLLQLQNIDELRSLWQAGIDSGSGQYTDIEAIKQEARRRLGQVSQKDA